MKQIAHLDLSSFQKPKIPGNRNFVVRSTWYIVSALVFEGRIVALVPSLIKAQILRIFGARVGKGFICKPSVRIKYPWFLEIADHVWLGEGVWIDNHCDIRIGSNVCVSQGVYIYTGNHDWNDDKFRFFCKPVAIADGVWVPAFSRLGPGTSVPAHTLYRC